MDLAETVMAEIDGIARRLEPRTRRKPDADVAKVVALLRLIHETFAADERKAWRSAAKLRGLH
jgi:hypothetical protein